MITLLLFTLAPIFLVHIFKWSSYKNGVYYQITKHFSHNDSKGRHLEYLTYRSLRHFEKNGGKFLFNTFIPKWNNETTEIDVLFICAQGIFVFECKNFSGWIFGHEAQKRWTQTLPKGRGRCHKEQFYNPIMQNASHIRHLKNLVGKKTPIWSIIVFADKCVFKDLTITSNDISVINHYMVAPVVANICNQTQEVYTKAEINKIYNKLQPYTQSAAYC